MVVLTTSGQDGDLLFILIWFLQLFFFTYRQKRHAVKTRNACETQSAVVAHTGNWLYVFKFPLLLAIEQNKHSHIKKSRWRDRQEMTCCLFSCYQTHRVVLGSLFAATCRHVCWIPHFQLRKAYRTCKQSAPKYTHLEPDGTVSFGVLASEPSSSQKPLDTFV